jgi:hypothetical protein
MTEKRNVDAFFFLTVLIHQKAHVATLLEGS